MKMRNKAVLLQKISGKMKLLKLIFFFCLTGALSLNAQHKEQSVDIEGKISCENVTLKGALIQVTQNGKFFTSFVTDVDGSYNVYLPLNAEYEISASKDGYVKKLFTINTTGVPAENIYTKYPVIETDITLLKLVEGVDYSLFDEPINKFYYNSKKDNFEYDKEYLKMMLDKIAQLKKSEKDAIKLAAQKAEEAKKQAQLAAIQKAKDELKAQEEKVKADKEAYEKEAMARLDKELQESKKKALENAVVSSTSEKTKAAAVDALYIKGSKTDAIAFLLIKYKPGVTEEVIEGKGVIIIQRVLVRDEMAWVYQKKMFSWGGVACFRDGMPITETIFEQETRKNI